MLHRYNWHCVDLLQSLFAKGAWMPDTHRCHVAVAVHEPSIPWQNSQHTPKDAVTTKHRAAVRREHQSKQEEHFRFATAKNHCNEHPLKSNESNVLMSAILMGIKRYLVVTRFPVRRRTCVNGARFQLSQCRNDSCHKQNKQSTATPFRVLRQTVM